MVCRQKFEVSARETSHTRFDSGRSAPPSASTAATSISTSARPLARIRCPRGARPRLRHLRGQPRPLGHLPPLRQLSPRLNHLRRLRIPRLVRQQRGLQRLHRLHRRGAPRPQVVQHLRGRCVSTLSLRQGLHKESPPDRTRCSAGSVTHHPLN